MGLLHGSFELCELVKHLFQAILKVHAIASAIVGVCAPTHTHTQTHTHIYLTSKTYHKTDSSIQ